MSDTDVIMERPEAKTSGGSSRRRRGRALLIVIIVILLLSLCTIGAIVARLVMPDSDEIADKDEAGGLEWVRSIYGFGERPAELFVKPVKVEVGAAGDIYVTDEQHRFVSQFGPTGEVQRFIGEEASPTLFAVGAIAEGDGQIFTAQAAKGVIRVFTEEGDEESSLPFPSPNDLEWNGEYLAVASNLGFVIFDRTGQVVAEVGGEQGDGPDQFDVIPGLAWGPDNTLYVLDAYNNRMNAYNVEGERLWQVRTGKPAKGLDITNPAMAAADDTTDTARLQLPSDVVVDGAGRLVVVDAMDFSITVFDSKDGRLLKKYGSYGTKDGQLMYPMAIDYDAERDWFVVADSGNRRVQILRIPESSTGAGAAVSTARRVLAGPLRACLMPILLFLLVMLVWFMLRKIRDRRSIDNPQDDDESITQVEGAQGS